MPLLAPQQQAFVHRNARATSLLSMVGVPHDEDEGEQQKLKLLPAEDDDGEGLTQHVHAGPEDISRAATNIEKRTLYKQLSETDVPWFPHDSAIELLKEFCWEAGRPRWVLFGTPAGGAGIHGCLEVGCSVAALCHDAHHRTHLHKFMLEKAVEALVTGATQVFKDDDLLARSVELSLTTATKAASANTTPRSDEHDTSDEKECETKLNVKVKEARNKRSARATPKNKKASRGRARSDSRASDSNGESDASIESDSDGATRTLSTRRLKNK